jgi:hypothetical protein
MDAQPDVESDFYQLCLRVVDCDEALGTGPVLPCEKKMETLASVFGEIEELVKTITMERSRQILSSNQISPLIPRIRALRAHYEFEQEKSEALNLLQAGLKGAELAERITAPYSGSAIFDSGLQAKIAQRCKSCLIVGSGPLPVTALLFLSCNTLDLTCLDISPESGEVSNRVFDAIGLYPSVHHVTADVQSWADFSPFDLIFINGLVGSVDGKEEKGNKFEIVNHITQNKGQDSLILLRSGYGLSQLFYPQITPSKDKNTNTTTIHPSHLGRSSIVYFETC